MNPPENKQARSQVDAWNARHQVGAAVTYVKNDNSVVHTVTRSKAEVLSGHTAVIWLENVRGCVLLARVKV
jgi:hypothetical protein